MEVKIENFILNEAIELFFEMTLKGRDSRHRTRFVRMLNERLESISEEQTELLKEHCHLDEDGEPKTKNDGKEYDIKDLEAFSKDRQDLLDESFVIDGGDNKAMLMTLRSILDNYQGELSGRKAVLYEHLCEIFKVDEELESEEG